MKTKLAILHLEAADGLARDVRRVLKQAGLNAAVKRVADLETLRALARSRAWDAVLAVTPHRGLPFITALKAVRTAHRDPPFIVLSPMLSARTAVRALKAGAHDFLCRDDLHRLPAVIRREIREAHRRKRQREAEEAFEASERHYRVLFDCASDPVLIHDFSGLILNANKIACVRLGYTRAELLRKTLRDINPEADASRMREKIKHLKRLGQNVFETELLRRDGARIQVEVNARIIEFGGGKAVLSSARDITERKLAEEALRRSEEKYRELAENMNDILYTITPDGVITYISPAVENLAGYIPEELLGRSFFEFIHRDDTERARANLREILQGRSYTNEYRFKYKKGNYHWMRTSSRPVRQEGCIIGSQGILSDVTERRKAEDAFRALSARNEAMLHAVPDIIMEVDLRKRYVWANNAGYEFFGRDVIGHTADYYFEGEQTTYDTVQDIFDGEEKIVYVESWQRRRDGQNRLLAWWCRTLKDREGRVTGALSSARDITAQKQAEEALRVSERRLSEAMQIAGMGGWEYDAVKDYFVFNDNFYAIFGVTEAEMGGYIMRPEEYARRFLHPDDRHLVDEEMKRAFTTDDPAFSRSLEHRIIRRDGTTGYISVRYFIIKDKDGRTIKTYGVNQDITERRLSEEAMRESEEKFRRLFQYSAAGIVLVGTDRRFQRVNDAFSRMLGYAESELTEMTVDDITFPDDRAVGNALIAATIAGEKDAFQLEKRYVRRDGTVIWGLLISTLIRDTHGAALYFVSQIQDITVRKRAEQALRESEERLSIAREAVELGIYDFDAQTRTIHWDARVRELWGLGDEDRVTFSFFLSRLHPDDRARVRSLLRRVFEPSGDGRYSEEFRVSNNVDGKERWIAAVGRVFFGRGRVLRLVGTFQDITARKRAEEALRESETRYRELFEHINTGVVVYEAAEDGRDFIIKDLNRAAERITGEDRRRLIGRSVFDVNPSFEKHGLIEAFRRTWRSGEPMSLPLHEYRDALLVGWHDYFIYRLPSGEIVAVLEDVTQRKRMEEGRQWELIIQNALTELYLPIISPDSTLHDISRVMLSRARALTASRHGFVSLIDPDSERYLTYASSEAETEEGGPVIPLKSESPHVWEDLRVYALAKGEAFFTNSLDDRPGGNEWPEGHFPVERFLAAPVTLGERVVGQIALANSDRHYTERDLEAVMRLAEYFALAVQNKWAEDKVKSSLREKVLMLKEIHHRIKNNLQVVMSLLNLQIHHLDDARARSLFRENQFRIKSMALIHERLYQSNDLSHVDFKEYISKLAVDLFRAYRIDVETIRLTVRADDITLGIDTSVPCGLIINELLLNSLKHAFPKGRKGNVSVTLERTGRENLLLTVADDGIGLPRNFQVKNSKSLGFNLVVALTDQLHGALRVQQDRGTRIEISFRARD